MKQMINNTFDKNLLLDNPNHISKHFNNHFCNIAKNVEKEIPQSKKSFYRLPQTTLGKHFFHKSKNSWGCWIRD